MRRLTIFILLFVSGAMLCAQSSMSELYTRWMIEDINQGKFKSAIENIKKTDLEYSDYYTIVDTLKMEEFIDFSINNKCLPNNAINRIQSHYISSLVALGDYYMNNQNFYLARIYLYLAHKICNKYNNRGESYLTTIHLLGRWHRIAYIYTEAEYYYLQHLECTKKLYGNKSILYAYALDNLSLLYNEMCMFDKAENYALRALNLEKKLQGEISSDIAITLTNLGEVYKFLEQYDKSITYLQQSLNMTIEIFGEYSQRTAIAYDNLAIAHQNMRNYTQARICLERSVDIQKKIKHTNSKDYAITLQNLSYQYLMEQDTISAVRIYRESIETSKNVLGTTHPLYVSQLLDLASLEVHYGRYDKADVLLAEAQYIERETHSDSTELYIDILIKRGTLHKEAEDHKNAISYFQKSLDILQNTKSYNYCEVSALLGSCYYAIGRQKEARKSYLESISTLETYRSTLKDDYYNYLLNVSDIFSNNGEYQLADSCYNEVYSWYKKNKSKDELLHVIERLCTNAYRAHDYNNEIKYISDRINVLGNKMNVHTADACVDLGGAYMSIGQYKDAKQCFDKAMQFYNKNTIEPLKRAILFNNLSVLYLETGNYDKAEHYALKAFEIKKDAISLDHPSYALALNTLAVLYCKLDKFQIALEYGLKASELNKLNLGEESDAYIRSLCDNSKIYFNLGMYQESESQLLTALEILSRLSISNVTTNGLVLSNLADLYSELGNYENAEKYYLEALRIAEDYNGKNHENYFIPLHNLGLLYLNNGDFSKGWDLIMESLDIATSIYGDRNTNLATIYCNISSLLASAGLSQESGNLLLQAAEIVKENDLIPSMYLMVHDNIGNYLNKYDKSGGNAERYFEMCVNYSDSLLGKYHPDRIEFLNSLGLVQIEKGKINDAYKTINEEMNILKEHVLSLNNYMTEKQRTEYNNIIADAFHTPLLLCLRSDGENEAINRLAYDNIIFNKGYMLRATNQIQKSIFESNDTTLISQWNELTTKKQQIQVLQEKEPQSDYLKQIQEEAEQLEKQITRYSAAYRENQAMWQITWDSVQNHLSSNDVAIEYFSAPLSEDSTMYCALLLRHDSKYPELIPLFEEKEVSSFLSTSNGNITNQTYDYYANGDTISQLVWSKIQPKLKGEETIYFAPSGLLHQLAIEYLPYDANRTMSDVYNMVRLSSTREIVLNKQNTEYTTATIYGGIVYDTDTATMQYESRDYNRSLFNSQELENDTTNRGSVKYLYGTKIEAEYVDALLRDNNIMAKLYTATKANEESFKSLSGKHDNILHIGTHGFTWTDSVAKKQDYFSQRMRMQMLSEDKHHDTSIDPLNRCGLLFAGANIALQGNSKNLPEGVQDGILTAKEISLMDLRDANLVVLSACETAKGDITSEGVFGLQRAFKMAGVQTIIMSLWKVNDQATQILMTEFYNNWIGKKQSKREAFRNAQNSVRYAKDKDGDYKYNKPIYWAGFIMLD